MHIQKRLAAGLSILSLLASCGGGGGGSGGTVMTPPPSAGTPTPTAATCSLQAREQWVLDQMREWYLFPDTLPDNPNLDDYSSVPAFLDALTAGARAQGKDRNFTYLTSISGENAYYESGQTAGLGLRLSLAADERSLEVIEAFEQGPALDKGLDRGARITGIGTASNNIRSVETILAEGGVQGLNDALGPSTDNTTRYFRFTGPDDGAGQTVAVTKTDYAMDPVSSRYGAKIIEDGGNRYGYVNLRTFISPADPALRDAFQKFQNAGVDQVIVDFRYNGGGLINIAELMGNLLGGDRSASDVFAKQTFRPEKSEENKTSYFDPQPQSIAARRIAFIGTSATASASELVANAFIPYLHDADGLIGSNTFGKPVGQIGLDQEECDDRLRVIAFALQNADGQGGYFDGLAGTVEASCAAADDIDYPLGDPREASTRAALDFLEGKSCTPIAAPGSATTGQRALSVKPRRRMLRPAQPTTPQREVPGLY